MTQPPKLIGEARLVRWSVIDDRHRPTRNCRQIVAGELQGPASGLAIYWNEAEKAYYLYGCDKEWNTVSDTWHKTLKEALEQAEFEYERDSATWNVA